MVPPNIVALQTAAWAATANLLDPDRTPRFAYASTLEPTVATCWNADGRWSVTVTIADGEPPNGHPGSWSVMATNHEQHGITFRSSLDQRHVTNQEAHATWTEMLNDLLHERQQALTDEQRGIEQRAPMSETFHRVLNAPEPEADEADVRAVRSATNARSAIRWADRLIADWQRDRDTDRPQMSDNMSVEAAALRAWAKAPVGTAHVLRFGAPLTVVALAKSYNAAGDDDGLVAELVALAERLADRINSAMAGVAGPAS